MSGSAPSRAAGLEVPVPRGSGAIELPTEEHAFALETGEVLAPEAPDGALHQAGWPSKSPAALEGSSAGSVEALEHPAEPSAGPRSDLGDDTPTDPGLGAIRGSAIWFWLWGPLLAAVIVVSFLAGMASAPVVLPEPAEARPARILDVQARPVATVVPPAPAEQLSAEQMPDLLLAGVVAVQDPGYYSRRSLSAADLLAAGAADLVRVRRRGGTIEERYARQVRVAAGSVAPSLRESTVAVRLSQRLSRRALLARYVNGLYFGNGIYGVGAASRFYFGLPVAQLDPAHVAMLAGIADDPAARNPLTAPAAAVRAQNEALDAMRSAGVLTAEQVDVARRTRVEVRVHRQLDRPSPAPDFTALVESALLSRFGEGMVYGSDLQVRTPLDLDLQSALDASARSAVGTANPGVLAVASDPRTGDVRALLTRGIPGGAGEVLFRGRPLGSLATALPVPVGDGRTASVGDVAAAAGAVAADGVRRDLRAVTSVQRPDASGGTPEVLDTADPLPPGSRILSSDRATSATETFRAAARSGPAGTRLPFALASISGSAGADSWYVGCVPELCLTVWVGPQGPSSSSASSTAGASLAPQIVAATFTRYLEVAPGRIRVPDLPSAPVASAAAVEPRRPVDRATPTPRPTPSGTPKPTSAPTAGARPTPGPTVGAPTASASPSPSAPSGGGGSGSDGSNSGNGGTSVAEGDPVRVESGNPR